MLKKITTALVSVYNKEMLAPLIQALHDYHISLYATGGTQSFIEAMNIPVTAVENLTQYPSILGGRVKTLHPKIFGGILARSENSADLAQLEEYNIPLIDLVIVDLYPFAEAVAQKLSEEEITEKTDIGGVSLIRAAAKNFKDVVVISSKDQYKTFVKSLKEKEGCFDLQERRDFATAAFSVTADYDKAIFNYFSKKETPLSSQDDSQKRKLRYGENPHQSALFYGNLEEVFEQLHGKELSYNNLLDADAALALINDFDECSFGIIKHGNACGFASGENAMDVWKAALAGDPVSAFGGVIVTNRALNAETANEINQLFFELLIAPAFDDESLKILKQKKNRILLRNKNFQLPLVQSRSLLNGRTDQTRDIITEGIKDLKTVTETLPSEETISDLIFANKIAKHSKSNAIVIAKNKQLLGSGTGCTSRVDAANHAVEKANNSGCSIKGAVMASDAFFPFADCVKIARAAGITAIIQPGGSMRDKDSIDLCNQYNISMIFTGIRHFKH